MRRIVIDTGVLESAAIKPHSIPALALQRALATHTLLQSEATFAELERVLLRDKFEAYAPRALRQAFVEGIRAHAEFVPGTSRIAECRDPNDDKFLALALDADAELMLSSDIDRLALNPWRGVPILTPADFLVMPF
ncbi:MAG: putative toxin-antitoxin system toxin component, PIN family [Burkholderiales bacterium]|nr:putative toxin-antitoxin system toxin component, PIN family [Burkholderiales bacterium]